MSTRTVASALADVLRTVHGLELRASTQGQGDNVVCLQRVGCRAWPTAERTPASDAVPVRSRLGQDLEPPILMGSSVSPLSRSTSGVESASVLRTPRAT